MPNTTQEMFTARIDQLKREFSSNSQSWRMGNIYVGIVNLATMLYGKESPVLYAVHTIWDQNMTLSRANDYLIERANNYLFDSFSGILHTIENDVYLGLVGSLEARLQGEVFADFVASAKAALDNEKKDVAAVLACAAFEDAIKRYADYVGIPPAEEGLQATINLLKSKGLVGGAQKGIIDSFVRVRNAAMHADWEKIHAEDVRGVIGFVEQFLITKFETRSCT